MGAESQGAGPNPPPPNGALERRFGLWAVFAIASGAMISSGIFVLPGIAFHHSGPSMILAYALAGLLNIPSMLAQAELVTAMPKSAGSYFVVERSLGAYLGTVAGLINWCSIGLKAAFALIGIGTLAEILAPGAAPGVVKAVSVAAAVLFTGLNLVSAEGSGRLQGLMVIGLLAVLGLYIGGGIPALRSDAYRPFFAGGFREFMSVTGMVFVSYGGLTKVVDVAEEIRAPHRTLPRGMFLSYAVVNLLYVGVALVTVSLLPGERLAHSLHPVQDGAVALFGTAGALVVGLGALLSYATTGNAGILSASRSPLAMSRDGLLPAFLSRTHPRYRTPHAAVLLTGLVMTLTLAFLSIENLVKTASAMLILSLAFIHFSVIVMRKSRIEGYRPTYRMPLVPWLPLATIALYGFLLAEMGAVALTTTFGFIAAASLWYLVYVRHRIQRRSALAHLVRSALSRDLPRSRLEDELVTLSLEREGVVADRFDGLVREASLLDLPERLAAPELFGRIADLLGPEVNLPPDAVRDLLRRREEQASTVIHAGVALPHIVVPGPGVFRLLLARCREGADFPGAREPVHVLFVLAGSTDERNFHLRALMAVAHVVQSPGFLDRWKTAPRTEQLRDIVLLSRRLRDSAATA